MALTTVDSGLLSSGAQYTGFKNRIINGDMKIDQRNAGASVTVARGANGVYTVDRWNVYNGGTNNGNVTAQQDTTAPTGNGFVNALKITNVTGGAAAAGDNFSFYQPIEGLNVSDLGWTTASPSPITISFYVKCSQTGTYGIAIRNSAANRSYVAAYAVNSANTWEYKTVTIPGDTTGTWLATNGVGMYVSFALGVGSTFQTAAGSWQAGNYFAVTGQQNLCTISGATFAITGVQLEKGSTATSFDYRPYSTELALCERYYQVVCNGNKIDLYRHTGVSSSIFVPYHTNMRATPSISLTRNSTVYGNINTNAGSSGLDASNITNLGIALYLYTLNVPEQVGVTATITANAEL